MARLKRIVVPGYPHHVTQRGVRKQTVFFDDADYKAYLDIAMALRTDSAVDVWAYCLMPNHVHMVVIPRSENSLARFFGRVHSRYARRTNRRHGWSGHLWQERFYSAAMDEKHTIAAMRYVEFNPVRAMLCTTPLAWPWSSARGNVGAATDSLIDTHNASKVAGDWSEFLAGFSAANEIEGIRKNTRTGRPIGDDQFVGELERVTGQALLKRRPGPRPTR